MARLINSAGLALVKEYERFRDKAYKDTGGVWTCGYGHIKGVDSHTVCTPEIAEAWLESDLENAENAVSELVKVPLTDNQYAALVAFTFNVGRRALAQSTLLRKLNAENYAAVPDQLRVWVFDNGRVIEGLKRRRAAEANLWSMK